MWLNGFDFDSSHYFCHFKLDSDKQRIKRAMQLEYYIVYRDLGFTWEEKLIKNETKNTNSSS